MKYVTEFRNQELVEQYLSEIKKIITRPWKIMEVCGGQTHSLVKNGILNLLPKEVEMIHGPGCPVCVTPLNLIDKAIYLAEKKRRYALFLWRHAQGAGFPKKLVASKGQWCRCPYFIFALGSGKIGKRESR